MRYLLVFLSFLQGLGALSQSADSVLIVFYNTENFFDCRHDTLKDDYAFLPDGVHHWTYTRFERKAEQTARVIANAGGWQTPVAVGLCEVENKNCLQLLCRKMPSYPYRFLHFESNDRRGIDVALLYDTTRFHLVDSTAIRVNLSSTTTRDILYAAGTLPNGDTLHLFVCHLPSMSGGKTASDWKRQAAKTVLQHHIDSLTLCHPDARIVVMGDMNDVPKNDLSGVCNRMIPLQKKGLGTEKFAGRWTCLDQFYLSPSLDSVSETRIYDAFWLLERDSRYVGYKPKRTFNGYRYRKDGYSDHLPIILKFPEKRIAIP